MGSLNNIIGISRACADMYIYFFLSDFLTHETKSFTLLIIAENLARTVKFHREVKNFYRKYS